MSNIKLNLEMPLNGVSFGQCSHNIIKELHKCGAEIALYPIGPLDVSCYDKMSGELKSYIENSINNRYTKWSRENATLKLWHLEGQQTQVLGRKYVGITFVETDGPTEAELKTVESLDKTLFTAKYYTDLFKTYGIDENKVDTIPLGFDEDFGPTGKTYFPDLITTLIAGKWENRKFTKRLIQLWVKKYGNSKKHRLICMVYNPFFNEQDNQRLIMDALEGKSYHNITFLPRLKTNSEVNDVLNAIDIDMSAVSGGEAWALIPFHSCALGKTVIGLRAHGVKEWANEKNAILIKPSGMITSIDGIFFAPGRQFSQGNFFNFKDEELVAAMEKAETTCKTVNTEGLKLQQDFTWKKTVDKILEQTV